MSALVFDGDSFAASLEEELAQEIKLHATETGVVPQLKIAAVAFMQDPGSRLYSEVKRTVATRLGIEYDIHSFDFDDDPNQVLELIKQLNQDPSVTGIIIQKPSFRSFLRYKSGNHTQDDFRDWWQAMIMAVLPEKDVDGLTGKAIVTPATCEAVLKIFDAYDFVPTKLLIIGRSDLVGLPLAAKTKDMGYEVDLVGKYELKKLKASFKKLKAYSIIVSATGVHRLIMGNEVANGVKIIDVGEPKADFDFKSCFQMASFITPVPGGVGPMTVISLMQNCWYLYLAHQVK
jgi:5,10-methylene-tetrahydrofolate dehydrogenase/methenyl tetrahydrofolate cyclohydrolase